ncbi:ParB/RepB/Spo0J family partition protein [Providencia rettgeri]|uniref:ParB/RepB/Spo0J family partition protein n=2 Tax=Providencia rettgeri TaxID=587 RepID=UPI003016D88A
MSTLETIINPKQRKAKKGTKSAQADAIYQALDSMEAHVLPLSALVQSELNVRKRPIDEKALSELADSIQAVGVLQNLVVYPMDNDVYGVAAGQRRLLALQQLVTKGHLASSFPVPVKVVSESDALIISLTENSQREAMHPADQLHAFIELQKTGKNASEIGDLLGFSTHHVKKCLRLANMAPELLAELDADNITLDQLQALAGTPDHDRQVMVWNNAMGWKKEPRYLREAVEETKTPVEDNRLVKFVGLNAYEQAGGTLEIDLFTEAGFIENAPLLEKLALDKLTASAELLADIEGWQWSLARLERPNFYGDESHKFTLSSSRNKDFIPTWQAQIDELNAQIESLEQRADQETDSEKQRQLEEQLEDFNQLFDHAKPLNDTAIGRALSRQMGLGESHEGKFVYPSTKYPEPHVAWPVFDEHGKSQGTMLQAIELDGDKLQGLRAEGRLLGSEQAQFIVVKPSQNGHTVIVNSLESAFETMAQQPEQGVVVQLNPDERLHTAMIEKITQGEVDNAYANPNATQTDKADSDPKNLQTPEEQAIDKALKEAEAALRQQANSEPKVPELSEDELRQVMAQERDSLLKGEHDLMEAKERVIEKAVQLEREHQQQQRDVLRQQEREMVMEKSRDREFGD